MHMKNMRSHIDIFWITARGKIVKIYRDVSPIPDKTFSSYRPVAYAIESKPGILPYEEGDLLDMKTIVRRGSLSE